MERQEGFSWWGVKTRKSDSSRNGRKIVSDHVWLEGDDIFK